MGKIQAAPPRPNAVLGRVFTPRQFPYSPRVATSFAWVFCIVPGFARATRGDVKPRPPFATVPGYLSAQRLNFWA